MFLSSILKSRSIIILLLILCSSRFLIAEDSELLSHFHLPADEISIILPFYEQLAGGNIDSAMQYVKRPPENFVGAWESIRRDLSAREGVKRFISVSWKSYPQWSKNPEIWIVVGVFERQDTFLNSSSTSKYENYPEAFTDCWVKESGAWKMVPEDFVYNHIDIYYENHLTNK
jgi:hypothetical protein